MRRRTTRTLGVLAGVATALLLGLPLVPSSPRVPRGELVDRVLQVVDSAFIDDTIDEDLLLYEGLDRMLRDLDRYSGFVSPDELAAHEQETEGYFVGIGVVIGPSPRIVDPETGSAIDPETLGDGPFHPEVTAVIPRGPASEAGVRVGDRIHEVDGHPLSTGTSQEATQWILGPEGAPVTLLVENPPGTMRTLTVTRRRVDVPSVTEVALYRPENGAPVGLVRLEGFKPNSPEEVALSIENLVEAGARAVILDLRGNGGGLMLQSIDLASLFLPHDALVLRTVGRVVRSDAMSGRELEGTDDDSLEHEEETYEATGPTRFPDLPLAILIDRNSASASDILASALRDHRRAPLIGEESYGKWAAQSAIPLSRDGRYGLVKLTTQHFFTATSARIRRDERGERHGLVPDVAIAVDAETRELLALEWRSRAISRITEPYVVAEANLPTAVPGDDPRAIPDPTLARAIDLLSHPENVEGLFAPDLAAEEARVHPDEAHPRPSTSEEDGAVQPASVPPADENGSTEGTNAGERP